MKKCGVILELRRHEAVVINDQAQYEKIKRIDGMFEGQMVEYTEPNLNAKRKAVFAISKVAAMFLILFLLKIIFFFDYLLWCVVRSDFRIVYLRWTLVYWTF